MILERSNLYFEGPFFSGSSFSHLYNGLEALQGATSFDHQCLPTMTNYGLR